MSKVQFSNEVDHVLLPMNHSFTNGVKTAKVVRLESYKINLKSKPNHPELHTQRTLQKRMPRKMPRPASLSKIVAEQKQKGTTINCEICNRKCSTRSIYQSHMGLHGASSNLESSTSLKNELELALYGKNFSRRKLKYRNKLLSSPKTILKRHLNKTATLLSNILHTKN